MRNTVYDAIVAGAGAAGLMCAAEAGRRGRRVLLLEHADQPGRKILISGGGRCNFTNAGTRPENFLSSNPHFARSALARYTPADFVALVERHAIPYHEKKLGQLFCDRSASDIVGMLVGECRAAGVELVTGAKITDVRRGTEFLVETSAGAFSAPALVIASGGLSIPKIGATSFGYDVARKFGHQILQPRPALVPLVFAEPDRKLWCDLAGVAADCVASFGRTSFRERMLITHRGLSGPAVLQISSYWDGRSAITFDLLPDGELEPRGNRNWKTVLSLAIPRRLAERWLEVYSANQLEERLHRWEVIPSGTEGFAKAEVTAGGVDTDGLSSRTMESRVVPGLYFIGEVVDVTGHLGGYNFQWAWASGYAAGQAI